MISTEKKYARAMKLALDRNLPEPIDYEAATARDPKLPDNALDRVLDLLISMLEELDEPLHEGQDCPRCGERVPRWVRQ